MKTRKILISSLLAGMLLWAACAGARAAQSASVLLQEGIYAEEIEGDLDAAIKIYEKIVSQAQQTEQAAAMAMYRIGMCRLKKGDKAGAAAQFEQVVKKYPGQKALVAKARSQLAKIQPASVSTFRAVVDSSNNGKVYFYDFDKEKVFPCPEWLTRDSPMKKVEEWGRKNGIDLVIGEDGHIELAEMVAVKVAYGLWDSAGAAEVNGALDKGPHETISLKVSDRHQAFSPVTYVFETREGGKGMLQIMGKDGGNVRIRYKMLDREALAAEGKVNVYEYLPMEVLQHIAGKYGSISSEAAAKNLYSNSHIYFITPDWVLLKAGMGYHTNSTGRAITGRIRLSGTSNPKQTLYDIAGREMNVEIVPAYKVRKNFYLIYWTPSEPLAPGQMFYYGWSADVSTPLDPATDSGNYSLRMHNQFGNRCIETFFLVVPEGTRLVGKTEDFTVKNTVADFDIYYWSKEVPPSTSNTVDVKLAPSLGHAEFGGVETATLYDIDHPKTKGKRCAIDLDTGQTRGFTAKEMEAGSIHGMMSYLAGEGVDAVGEFAQNKASLIALGMVVEVKAADAWEDLTGAELLVSMSGRKAGATETTIMQWKDEGEQSVFAFVTREGAIGLLQIVSADAKSQKFEVRYKKVSGAAPGTASASETVSSSPGSAADMLPALRGLMVGVFEAIEKNDTDTAVELLDKLIAGGKKVVRSMEGASAESGVAVGVETLEMIREALVNKQMDKVQTLLDALNQMGPGLERAVEEQGAKRRKPYGAPNVE